jgi:hypothetical protein
LNMQISMILHQCTFKSAIRLSMLFFKMTTFTVQSQAGTHHLVRVNTGRQAVGE